jgi:hypothetical protein
VSRDVLSAVPITLVDRARAQLARFFADGPWTVDDDAALAATLGPGQGWNEAPLDAELTLGYGWRGNVFRLELRHVPSAGEEPAAAGATVPSRAPHPHTLGDTFETPVVLECPPGATRARLNTGPGTGGRGTFERDGDGRGDDRVAAVFAAAPGVQRAVLGPGWIDLEVETPAAWHDDLLAAFDAVVARFVPVRPAATDRQLERAQREVGSLDPGSARDLLRIVDALTSPDASSRMLAVARLEYADPFVADRSWRTALDDSSRAVRRATARAMAFAARGELRPSYERALADSDACVRYFGLRGLATIGVVGSNREAAPLQGDDDLRVRLAAEAAVSGRIPP